jgi:DcmR-like sensory protein
MESLAGFVEGGVKAGETVIIIATEIHTNALNKRLNAQGIDVNSLCLSDHYIPINAEKALSKFIVNGWPDEKLFLKLVKELIARARGETERKVRVYGEMVALLWAQGHNGATVQIKHLWNKLCETEPFCLFCAYPKVGFNQKENDSLAHVCLTHTKVISGDKSSKEEIFYKNSAFKR